MDVPILLRVPFGGGQRPLDPSKINPVLAENSWKTIARVSAEGIASQVWSVGDGIDIVLSGYHAGSITMQIAGFEHDELVTGGKAGITFLSKQVLGSERMCDRVYYTPVGWDASFVRSQAIPKIRGSLPSELQEVIKTVLKSSSKGEGNFTTEDDIFIPSLAEVLSVEEINQKYYGAADSYFRYAKNDGKKYEMFRSDGDLQKTTQVSASAVDWWTRSGYVDKLNFFGVITKDAGLTSKSGDDTYDICFGFCV